MIETLVLALAALPAPQQFAVNPRDRDPWVFRSVLDQRPRIVTLALNAEMWCAYDAQTCGLYKCWKGGVDLKGAVYTTVHGDQPVSRGPSYARGVEGVVWGAEKDGRPLAVVTTWRGYFFGEGRAHLMYEVALPDGVRISIQETPDYFSTEQILGPEEMDDLGVVHGLPVLWRSFVVDAVPDGVLLFARLRFDGEHLLRREVFPPGILRREQVLDTPESAAAGRKTFLSELVFATGSLRANVVGFFEPLPGAEPPAKGGGPPAPAAPKPGVGAPPAPADARKPGDATPKQGG